MKIELDKHTHAHILSFPKNGDVRYEFEMYWKDCILNTSGLVESDLIE